MKLRKAHPGWARGLVYTLAGLVIFAGGTACGFLYRALHEPRQARPVMVARQAPDVTDENKGKEHASVGRDLPAPPMNNHVIDYVVPPAVSGLAPVISRLPTKQPIVFLGIDDGAYKDPSVVQLMKEHHIKASLFLSKAFIANNPEFFKALVDEGSVIENHTLDHDTQMIKRETYIQQKLQICGMADYEEQQFGKRPMLFWPPGGAYSDTMRKAAFDCGMKAVVTWIAKANGGAMQYQVGNKLRPGDIVLMHFRPEFRQDLLAFVAAENVAGVHTELLEDALED